MKGLGQMKGTDLEDGLDGVADQRDVVPINRTIGERLGMAKWEHWIAGMLAARSKAGLAVREKVEA